MAECNRCGKEIKWVKMRPTMELRPVDPLPGKVVVLSDLSSDGASVGKTVDGYTPHFSTCPEPFERFG